MLLNAGCSKENAPDCLKSTGKEITQQRQISPFTELHVFDNLEVYLIQDTTQYLEVTAGTHLISSVSSEVKQDILTIKNTATCNWLRSYKKKIRVLVHTPHIKRIIHDGILPFRTSGQFVQDTLQLDVTDAGDFECDFKSQFLKVTLYESGNIYLKGAADLFQIQNYGLGKVYAQLLPATTIYVNSSGIGDSYVYPLDFLGVYFKSAGNVYYTGNPRLAEGSGPGNGKIIKLP